MQENRLVYWADYLSTDRLRHARHAMTWENFNFAVTIAADPRVGHISAVEVTCDTNRENR